MARTKLYIDDQIFFMQQRGGISRYFVELMKEFSHDPSYGVTLTGKPVDRPNKHLKESNLGHATPKRFGRFRPRVSRLAQDWNWRVRFPDIVHHTQYYDLSYLTRHPKAPLRVTTVYDMIPEVHPNLFLAGSPHPHKQEFVAAADLVICISESTKTDLISFYSTPENKVVVIPLGVDTSQFRPGSAPLGKFPERYVLYVGQRGGYKNFSTLAQAFANANLSAEVKLVAVGGGPFSDPERAEIDKLGLRGRLVHKVVPDRQLSRAYANADCFVFPSTIEGFGLPTLEAMASGCPTILADAQAHREVGGEATRYFPPSDHLALTALIEDLHESQQNRAELISMGLERVASFTWANTARMTTAAYEAALHVK